MACSPNQNQISLNPPPLPSVPGFGPSISPIQIPLDSMNLPENLLEDFNDLVSKLFLIFPSSTFRPNIEFPLKTILDYVSNLMSQVAPFLSLYNFFTAVLKMFACIIDVLCAIPNPFAVALKLKKLFAECLPALLALFPFFALPIMIISLLELLLELILYIIKVVEDIVDSILKNLEILGRGLQLNDANATLAAAQKIATLLCSLQNILAIFVAFAAILDIIKALAKLAGALICSDDDADGCCPPSICPDFIKNTPDGITVAVGKLVYFKKIGFDATSLGLPADIAAVFANTIAPVRPETWQIFDTQITAPTSYPINLIITPTSPDDNIFYPNDQSYSKTTPIRQAPYTADIRIKINPVTLGFTDTQGERFFRIKDCIIVRKPHTGLNKFNNTTSTTLGLSGVLDIEGGLVFEDDGITPYVLSGAQLTLNTFIHQNDSSSTSLPGSDDSLTFSDLSIIWKPNAPALAGLNLTTVGCVPEVNLEKGIFNSVLVAEGIEPVEIKFGNIPGTDSFLPDVSGAQDCINNAIALFRKNITVASTAEFQAATTTCLNTLQSQTIAAICSALIASISIFKSTVEIVPDIQFTSRFIQIQVTLKDATGTSLGKNIPTDCQSAIADKLTVDTTFGTVSNFTYDGSELFVANLSSEQAGNGTITVLFDSKVLSTYTPGANGTTPAITENTFDFSFVNAGIAPPERRDATDVAKAGS
jgi:hypothetical protein